MKALIIAILTLTTVPAFAGCDKYIDCLLILSSTEHISVHNASYNSCRTTAIKYVNQGAKKVKMKFWDDQNGRCIEENFKR